MTAMMRLFALSLMLVLPSLAMAGNFATCLLDELPGTQNDNAAGAAYQVCSGKYPARYDGVAQGSGRGFFGYDSGAECALAKAKDTRSNNAAGMIRVACNRLYNAPTKDQAATNLQPYNGQFTPIEAPREPAKPAVVASPPNPAPAPSPEENPAAVEASLDYAFSKYPFLDINSPQANEAAINEAIRTQNAYLDKGVPLYMAVRMTADIVGPRYVNQKPSRRTAAPTVARPVSQRAPCVYQQVMTNADYEACGLKPPGQ